MYPASVNVYFGGKLIRADGAAVVRDRLGSVVARAQNNAAAVTKKDYFPYGDEIAGSTAGDVDKFGTYLRDATSGLDYADQRYFSGLQGRFLTSDPLAASAEDSDSTSWNRFNYVKSDPINLVDPDGRKPFTADNINCIDGYQWGMNFLSNWVGLTGDSSLRTTIVRSRIRLGPPSRI